MNFNISSTILWTIFVVSILFIVTIVVIYLKEKDDSGEEIVKKFDQQYRKEHSVSKLREYLVSLFTKK